MPATRSMRDVLAARASANFVGRDSELSILLDCVRAPKPLLAWVYGIAGIGKTALLREFAARLTAQGSTPLFLDCRFIEPTPEGFLSELRRVLKSPANTLDATADALSRMRRCVLILDSYEVFRLVDMWMRQLFLPALADEVRVVLCGRYGPGPGWQTAIEWQGLIRPILLRALTDAGAAALLRNCGVRESDSQAILGRAQGHPLSLVLAAFGASHGDAKSDDTDGSTLVQQLTAMYLAEAPGEDVRTAVEASSVIRRTTRSVLAAMLPDIYTREMYDRLADLSVIEASAEGLLLHEQVRDAVASWLRSSDPHRYRMYRIAAWRQLRLELESADPQYRWRYAADMLYLLQNPNVREAYFPSGPEVVSPEPARPEDEAAIFAIAEAHEPPTAAQIITHWWQRARDSFQVLRDGSGAVAGFYLLTEWPQIAPKLPETDPMACNWRRHLRDHPMGRDETAVYIRRWLSDSDGESPSRVQAACWMDVKRFYMRSRPHVRRCYVSLTDLATYGSPTAAVGFQVIPDACLSFNGKPCHLAVLDFGPNSIDGWVTGLVARELGVGPTEILDSETRELVLPDKRVSLTALEFGLLSCLQQQEGRPITRAALLERVWQQRADTGSNVVEAVVRALRTKLGDHAWMIATVRGVGYRFQGNQTDLTTR